MYPYSPVGIQSLPSSRSYAIIFCIMAVELDEIDIQLLTALQEDADRTNVELARHDPRSSNVFDDMIRALPQIIAADNVAGETDYLLTVVARDVAELQTVLASLATRGGQRLVTYLRLAEIKPPSRLPLAPTTAAPDRPARRRGQRNAPARE